MGNRWRAEAVGSSDAIASRGWWTRGIGMVLQTGTLEEVLLLARGVLCSDLLTVDALNGHALVVLYVETGFWSVTDTNSNKVTRTCTIQSILKMTIPLALNSTNAAWTSWSTVRPMVRKFGWGDDVVVADSIRHWWLDVY